MARQAKDLLVVADEGNLLAKETPCFGKNRVALERRHEVVVVLVTDSTRAVAMDLKFQKVASHGLSLVE